MIICAVLSGRLTFPFRFNGGGQIHCLRQVNYIPLLLQPNLSMRIEYPLRLIESYLNRRSGVLWALEDRAFNQLELRHVLDAQNGLLLRRRKNPSTWRPSELEQLADALSMPSDAILDLHKLAPWLNCLPDSMRSQLFKESQFDRSKFRVRASNPDAWQYNELQRLAGTLRRWQDCHKMDTLLVHTEHLKA